MDTDEFEPNSPESATAVAEAVKEGVPDRKCSNIWQASAYLSAIGIAVGCGFAFGDSMHELALVKGFGFIISEICSEISGISQEENVSK